jgi:TolA-binding protein
MHRGLVACAVAGSLVLCSGLPARGQGQAPIGAAADAMAQQALELLNNGKLTEAADAYDTLLNKYPNSGDVPEAYFRLGYIQYVQGDYATALTTLRHIASPPATPEVKTAGDALIPQVLAGKASRLPLDDATRTAAYQEAIDHFDSFLQLNPRSPAAETANYGRALCSYQIGDMGAAQHSLEQNLRDFPASETIADTEDLLAVVLTTQANDILKAHGDRDEAEGKYRDALRFLVDIIEHRRDVALSNDAQFQIGEILFNRGNTEAGTRRARDISHALDAYRAVLPNDTLIKMQEQRVAYVSERHREAVAARNRADAEAVQRVADRENAKLQSLKDGTDQTLSAQLRMIECYYLLQRYDECRVMIRFLEPFATEFGDKKQLAYYLTLSYAAQAIPDKAVAAYNAFNLNYRGDPIGENLPLAMGAAFLNPNVNLPQRAVYYFNQEYLIYPSSPLVNDAMAQQAATLISMQRYQGAMAVYQRYLRTDPKPEQAVQAQLGIANVYQVTNRIPDAIKQFRMIALNYPNTPEAEQGIFHAAALEIDSDPKTAIGDLQNYITKYPQGQFAARATMMIAQTQSKLGDTDDAVATFKDIALKYPNSPYAPQSYFQRASILAKQKKQDEMVNLMKEYITVFPRSREVFYAYDIIATSQVDAGQVDVAVATYKQMAGSHPDDPMAAKALCRIAELWRKQAEGREYNALNDADQKAWTTAVNNSMRAAESVLQRYTDSDQLGLALGTLMEDQEMRMDADQVTSEDVDKYFEAIPEKYGQDEATRKRILFTLATFTYKKDHEKGIEEMAKAYDPTLLYAPVDLDIYGQALLAENRADESYKLYTKIGADYPVPEGVNPSEAPPPVQEAQAISLYGMGYALDKEDKPDDAARLFNELKTYYPNSPKVADANYGIARALVPRSRLDEATQLLLPIVANRTVSASLRAHAFLLSADIQAAKGNFPAAIDSYLKMAAYYGGIEDAAPEGLWKGGQLLEKQASVLDETSTPKKSDQIARAVMAYRSLVSKYPDSQYVRQAQDRLELLNAKS